MPLPKNAVLQSTASLARNNDWKFQQTEAPAKGPGQLPEQLVARISPEQLPKTEPTKISGSVAGYSIEQQGRFKTQGTLQFKIVESSDGSSSAYFEALKGLNNPRNSSGELTGVGVLESDKEGEYSITQESADGQQVKKYVLMHAIVEDVESNGLGKDEAGEFVELTITLNYKDFKLLDANNAVIS